MRADIVLSIYKFKVKTFFGAFKTSKANVALLLVYIISFLPGVFSFSITIVDAIKHGGLNLNVYVESITALLNALMVFSLILALRGYTVFEHEQVFIFTSPVKPREFLVASILADLTSSLVFAHPIFLLYIVVVFSLNLSASLALLTLLAIFLFTLMLFFLKTSFSIMKSLRWDPWVNAFIYILIILLLLPAAGFFINIPLKYSLLPYPSKFMAEILIDILCGRNVNLISFLGLVFYFIPLTALFISTSKKNFFPVTTHVPFISPFDASIRTQTLKMERGIKIFSRMGSFLTLNLKSKSLLRFLMKKEIIRITREGSLFAVILMYLIVLVIIATIGFSSPQPQSAQRPPPAFLLMFFLGAYSLIVPLMLVSNWRISDLKNLWMPLTSGVDMHVIVKAILYDFILISSIIPSIIVMILSAIQNINPITPLTLIISTSVIGCSANLYMITKFLGEKSRGAPSLLVGWASMILSALLLTPTYILIALCTLLGLSDAISTLFSPIILFYSLLVMREFAKIIEKSIINIEI